MSRAGRRGTAVLGPLGGYWRVVLVAVLIAGTFLFRGSYGSTGAGPLRIAFTLLFMGFGPGMAVMGLLRLDDLVLEISLALALSLGLEMVLATGMIMVKHWVPNDELLAMVLLTVVGAAFQAVQVAKLRQRAGSSRAEPAKREP
ncbi:MAG TPA: hypothetical protein VKY26_02605 [Actinomycetota bacterium]|nr:hypothetical protein [Actinomycetota bacterium]